MREIKSRFWLKARHIMIYENFDRITTEMCLLLKDVHKGHLITRDPFSIPYCIYCGTIDIFREPDRDCVKSDENVIELEFTGLHDKNGKEIYEGDIIQIAYDQTCIGQVVYEDGRFTATEFVNSSYLGQDDVESMGIEVIGNIHENPELLEDK